MFAIESTPVLFRHVVLGEFQARLVYTRVLGDIVRPCLKNKQKPRPLLTLIKYPAVLEPDGLLLKLFTELTQGKIELTSIQEAEAGELSLRLACAKEAPVCRTHTKP